MLLAKEKLQHINSIAHEGKVVVVATDTDGKIWYTVKQDCFEDSYLNQKPEDRTGWEGWKLLELPNEADDQSVVEQEKKELTDQADNNNYLLRSRYKTQDQSAVAPVQLVSGLGHIYIFRQSKSNTLLVDRFVLDGMTNTINRKFEVRFKRSKQRYKPSENQKKGAGGLSNVDSLDFKDMLGNYFYEPTTELSLINNVANGWFSVVLIQTSEQDKFRWHIFAYNSQTKKVEITTLRASDEGLFDVKDYTILDPQPTNISGIIKSTITLKDITVANGLTATKYDIQRERKTESGELQLLRESTRVMLVVGTNLGNAVAISFAVAADGTLSLINDKPDKPTPPIRSDSRQILLPSNTLDKIKAIGTTNPPPQGIISGFARGGEDEVIITSSKATELDATKVEVKIAGNKDYNRLYSQVEKIDDNTFEITTESATQGNWEVVLKEETGLIFNGMVTAYEITAAGKLKVTALNHGLSNGESVLVVDTKDYNGTYKVTKVDDKTFSLDGMKWQAGSVISATLQAEKRRGVTFDGKNDYISLPEMIYDFSKGFTAEAWVLKAQSSIISFGNAPDEESISLGIGDDSQLQFTLWKSYDIDFPSSAPIQGKSLIAITKDGLNFSVSVFDDKGTKIPVTNPNYENLKKLVQPYWNVSTSQISQEKKEEIIKEVTTVIQNSCKYKQTVSTSVALDPEKWVHLAITIDDSGNAVLYKDGEDIANSKISLPNTLKRAKNYIGANSPTSNFFQGKLSDVRVWNQARKADEIKNSMYLSLTGKELGLVGYWRLDAIAEGKERKVIDFSVNGNDGIVKGGAYVSSVNLKRNLEGTATVATKYENEELFAVSERATYKEEFEFKIDKDVNPNKVDGSSKIFAFTYKGKKNRNSPDWISRDKEEKSVFIETTEFTGPVNGWYTASSTFMVPDGVSMVRSFGIKDVKGDWTTLDIRNHKIQLVFDSISKIEYTHYVANLIPLVDNQVQLQVDLKNLELREKEEVHLLKEKRELNAKIDAYNAQNDTREKIKVLENQVKDLTDKVANYLSSYGFEQSNPLNYYCYLSCEADFGKRVQAVSRKNNTVYRLEIQLPAPDATVDVEWQKFKFTQADSDSYYITCEVASRQVEVVKNTIYGLELKQQQNNDWQKFKFDTVDGDLYHITCKGETDSWRVHVYLRDTYILELQSVNNDPVNVVWQTFKFIKTSKLSNTKIEDSKAAYENANNALRVAKGELEKLTNVLSSNPKDKDGWDQRLKTLGTEITTIQSALDKLNTEFISSVITTQQTPQTMSLLNKDSRGLVTQGALLGFVRPASRISAIETCEGNVQLSYFDAQGRMRQTNFDATSDSKNSTFEQWVPDSLRPCLNFNKDSDVVKLDLPILPEEWTLEAWFAYPLPEEKIQWNTLTQSKDESSCHVIVKRDGNTELLGTFLQPENVVQFDGVDDYISCPSMSTDFSKGITVEAWVWYDSFNNWSRIIDFGNNGITDSIIFVNELKTANLQFIVSQGDEQKVITANGKLEIGKWIHLAATIDSSNNATLYKNGIKICSSPITLPKNLVRANNYIGKSNVHSDSYFKGKIADVRIWNKARTQSEIQADMNKRLSGKEDGLVAYYPLSDLVNKNKSTVTGAQLFLDKDSPFSGFASSGYDMRLLSPGWHHLTAVAQVKDKEAKTTFYINGNKVGETKGKSTSNVYAIGNSQKGGQQFGKVAEVRIWNIALSAEEIAVNSKTLLTGNEPDLLAYYPFNEATGTVAKDQTGSVNKGTITGASWWGCAAPIGNLGDQVMQFDGVNDYISCPELSSDFSKGITVETWVWYNSFKTWSRIIDFGNGAKSDNILFANNATTKKLEFQVYKGASSSEGCIGALDSLEQGTWIHLAATIDASGNAKLYKNGIQIGTPIKVNLPNNVKRSNNYIGRSNWSADGYLDGKLSDVRIWNTARSQEEIQADMNKRLTGKEAGLVAYYPLNTTTPEGSTSEVLDLVNNNNGTVTEAKLVSDQTLPIGGDAVVCCEYSTVSLDKSAMMRRFFTVPTSQGVNLLPDKRIEQLELKWIGNGQFAPTLLGYIEGAPPIPSENLTLENNYNGATSVELTVSEDVEYKWTRSEESAWGQSVDTFVGSDVEQYIGVGLAIKSTGIRAGFKGNENTSWQRQNENSITSSSSLSMSDKLQLSGTQEQDANFSHLGKRFIPKNVGYALVVSALADVFITRLSRTGKMIGYQVLPVENIPPDVNTITFLINPAYTMSGSLDGMTGSSATSQRFFKHVPEMRSQFGSLYPASYYRLEEAYDLKQKIDKQDTDREAYFNNFDSQIFAKDRLSDDSVDNENSKGNELGDISPMRSEDKPDDNLTKEQKDADTTEKQGKQEQATKEAHAQQSVAANKKQDDIQKKIEDPNLKANALGKLDAWQKKMEDIQKRSGKRNIVNTYVWDADGGLRAEAQNFADTAEHSIGGSFSLDAAFGGEGNFELFGATVELTAQATYSLTRTMSKTVTNSKGIELNIDLSGVESRGVTDYNDYPILPGEKVNRYRFMSFYLEGSTNNFNDFFSYVVDPEWLASNSEEARALRQAKGKANKAWRVLHRVTYVERPALMGFGRDIRQLPTAESTTDLGQLQAKVENLEQQNAAILNQLNAIAKKLNISS